MDVLFPNEEYNCVHCDFDHSHLYDKTIEKKVTASRDYIDSDYVNKYGWRCEKCGRYLLISYPALLEDMRVEYNYRRVMGHEVKVKDVLYHDGAGGQITNITQASDNEMFIVVATNAPGTFRIEREGYANIWMGTRRIRD